MRYWILPAAALLGVAISQPAFAQSETHAAQLDFAFLDRPLTLQAGQIELNAGLFHFRFDAGPFSTNATGLTLGGSYGITNQLEVGLGTGFGIDPDFDWGEFIMPYAAFFAHDTEQLDISVGAALPLDFSEGADILPLISLGAASRFALSSQFALMFGHGLVQIGLGDFSYVDIDLNLGVAAQLMPNLTLRADTQIASIAVTGDSNETSTLGDFIPLTVTGLFAAMPLLDVFAAIGFPDLGSAGDAMTITAGVLIRP